MDLSQYVLGGRPTTVSGLNPAFQSGLSQLFGAAPPDVQQGLRIISGYRTPEHQAELFGQKIKSVMGLEPYQRWQALVAAQGPVAAGQAFRPEARAAGVTKWVAPPGASEHQQGYAADLKYLTPAAQQWAQTNAGRFGLRFPLSNENWHVELDGARGQPMTMPAAGGGPAQPTSLAQQFAAPGPEMPVMPVLPQPGLADLFAMPQQMQRKQADEQAEIQKRRQALFAGPDPFA